MGSPNPACNTYDLTIAGAGTCTGTAVAYYCTANPHSQGNAAFISAHFQTLPGTPLHLGAVFGPPGEFGFFLVGSGASVPGASVGQGRLCLRTQGSAYIGRYSIPGPLNSLGQFGSNGAFVAANSALGSGYEVPYELPIPGNAVLTPGRTYFFQLWFRDGSHSNLTNAVAVRF